MSLGCKRGEADRLREARAASDGRRSANQEDGGRIGVAPSRPRREHTRECVVEIAGEEGVVGHFD